MDSSWCPISITDIVKKVSLAAAPFPHHKAQDSSKEQQCALRYVQEPRSSNELWQCVPVKSAEENKSLWGKHQDCYPEFSIRICCG